ncbi:choloylglycine hydrolase family protein [Pediococcus damnosus]|nr:choloylglycine hydrolase family protein [Pediococcus damnosus]KJU73642.1 penicillin acylase [Pediococcus damnosus LMG 28219]PIO85262.1 penicillin acylase [Pediococcus damnosus]PJE49283.1 linear amide C-N hydrolase [Pediococcus damnosus]GEA94072.1 penicillin V acylase [Pediococcus damnosus]
MCTSVMYQNAKGNWFLARTMDFSFELGGRPVVVPRNFHFKSDADAEGFDTKLGFTGAGRDLNGYILVDGVNEAGVGAATLYFDGLAKFAEETEADKINLAPHEMINWILGNVTSVAGLKAKINDVNIVAVANDLFKMVVPLHWIVADKTGACVVLEQDGDGMHVMDDPAKVMTNSPDFQWHLKNLNNYVQLKPTSHGEKTYGEFKSDAYGLGSGALGLPGDYTSVSRFVRAAFIRENTEKADTTASSINALSHILNSVEIPKGVKADDEGGCDYSQYRGYMSLDEGAYYMQPYADQTITRVALTPAVLNADKPTEYPLQSEQQFNSVN